MGTTFTQYGCGCRDAASCTDPKTFGRVAEPVDVLGLSCEPIPDEPRVFRIRFADGTEADAFEDELSPVPA